MVETKIGIPSDRLWLGVSASTQSEVDEAVPVLLATPAAVRFLSLEPLLGPIDFLQAAFHAIFPGLKLETWIKSGANIGIDWVIVGGESGPNARPMHPDWARSIRDQCQAARVPFMFKQWGEWTESYRFRDKLHWIQKADTHVQGGICVGIDGTICTRGADFGRNVYPVSVMHRVGKQAAGRLLDGRTWDEVPNP